MLFGLIYGSTEIVLGIQLRPIYTAMGQFYRLRGRDWVSSLVALASEIRC